jgi:hypothetical protein
MVPNASRGQHTMFSDDEQRGVRTYLIFDTVHASRMRVVVGSNRHGHEAPSVMDRTAGALSSEYAPSWAGNG